jgi:hypothetical protein
VSSFFNEIWRPLLANGIHYHFVACLAIIILLLWQPQLFWKFLKPIVGYFEKISDSRLKSVLFIAALAFVLYALFALCFRFPYFKVVDEFGFLLTADTFLHGRLTNPTHPFWKHFEYLYILHHPSYNSKYPVGQAVMLALGKLLSGYPIVGVWLSGVAACVAVYWMLLGWFSSRWALFGAIITICHPVIFFWSQVYWGGYVAMIGGSLLLGAVKRIFDNPKTIDAFIFGAGLFVLSVSRPYEGLVFALPLCLFLLVGFLRSKDSNKKLSIFIKKVALPIALVVTLNFSWLAYYNYSVTGNPLKLPYMEYTEQYDYVPLFLFQQMDKPVEYDKKSFAVSITDAELYRQSRESVGSFVKTVVARAIIFNVNYLLSPILLFFFVWSFASQSNRKNWLYLNLLLLIFIGGISLSTYFNQSYAAPIYGVFIILTVGAAREIWHSADRQNIKRLIVLSVPVCLLTGIILLGAGIAQRNNIEDTGRQRAEIEAKLRSEGGKHLIFVDPYPQGSDNPNTVSSYVYIYNEADIDDSKIVWANQLNQIENAKLVDYFGDRRVWLLKLDKDGKPQLLPYR